MSRTNLLAGFTKKFAVFLFQLTIFALGSCAIVEKPAELKATLSVNKLRITQAHLGEAPDRLIVSFSQSVAALDKLVQALNDIKVIPALEGTWKWTTPSILQMEPKKEWGISQSYSVTLPKQIFADGYAGSLSFTFTTPTFDISDIVGEYYEDPTNYTIRRAIYTIPFSHPIDVKSFEKLITISGTNEKPLISYDNYKMVATIQSEKLNLKKDEQQLKLVIKPGAMSTLGGNAIKAQYTKLVTIPSLFSLQITSMSTTEATNDQGSKDRILEVEFNRNVMEKEIPKNVSAWLLPKSGPGSDNKEIFKWKNINQVSDAILSRSQKLNLSALPSFLEADKNFAFKFVAPPDRFLFATVNKSLQSASGYQFEKDISFILPIERFNPELAILGQGSILSLKGDKKLSLLVRDLPGLEIELSRVLPNQIQHFVSQNGGIMTKPSFNYSIGIDNLAERITKKIPLQLEEGKNHYETVDFSSYLQEKPNRQGIFLLTVRGYNPSEKDIAPNDYEDEEYSDYEESSRAINPRNYKDSRLIMVSDLGIITKQNANRSWDVFVQSVADGQPVSAASVVIIGLNGATLQEAVTNPQGKASLPSVWGFNREKSPLAIVVTKDRDMSFIPMYEGERSLDFTRFDIGGVRITNLPQQLQAYLFSDRGIYRPGEEVRIGIILKSLNWQPLPTGLPLEMEVIDSRGIVIRQSPVSLDRVGFLEFAHNTEASSPTGSYSFNLRVGKGTDTNQDTGRLLGSVLVQVQEFLPDTMKISGKLSTESPEGWISPTDLKANILVQNLFGTAAQNRRIESILMLQPRLPHFKDYPEYTFGTTLPTQDQIQINVQDALTDVKGEAIIDLGLNQYVNTSYRMDFVAKAFEQESGRSVATRLQALVSDKEFMLGYKADGDLKYINLASKRNVHLQAIDSFTKKKQVQNITLVHIAKSIVSVLVRQNNGPYKYESKTKEVIVSTKTITIPAGGYNLPLDTTKVGSYAYELFADKDNKLSRIEYTVAGNGNITRSLERNAELELALDKSDYNPGDQISVNIRAPYFGAGLITIENDKVRAFKWFKSSSTATVQSIQIPDDFEGSGYVTVHFTRDPASNEVFMSPLSYGTVPFISSAKKRTAPASLSVPTLVKPGDIITAKVSANPGSKVVLFAVDEGILQVAAYKTPNPLGYFFRKRALEVSTMQTLDLILPEFKRLLSQAMPGGGEMADFGRNINPFRKKRDKPMAYWSGIITMKDTIDFQIPLPDQFNGAVRVMMVAVEEGKVVAKEATTQVRGDVIIQVNAPVVLSPGDQVEIGLGISNNKIGSGPNANVSLNFSVSPGLELLSPAAKSVIVGEGKEVSELVTIKTKSGAAALLGPASLTIHSKLGTFILKVVSDLTVRPASAYISLASSGVFTGKKSISAQSEFYPEFRKSNLIISPTPWALSTAMLQYLHNYPYGCTEQLVSSTTASVFLSNNPDTAKVLRNIATLNGLDEVKKATPDEVFNRFINLLWARQGSDGGFMLWPGDDSDIFITIYATRFLIEARNAGFNVPTDLLRKSNVYLQASLEKDVRNMHDWHLQTMAAYALTIQQLPTGGSLASLSERIKYILDKEKDAKTKQSMKSDIGNAYLAASLKILFQEKLANDFINPVLSDGGTLAMERALVSDVTPGTTQYQNSIAIEAELFYLVTKHFPNYIPKLRTNFWDRVSQVVQNRTYSTYSSAQIMLALKAYDTAVLAALKPTVKIETKLSGTTQIIPSALHGDLLVATIPTGASNLDMTNTSSFPLFYSWVQNGYEASPPTKALTSGIEIVREYTDENGKIVKEVKLGQEITVHIKARTKTPINEVYSAAIIDLLPAGFDPVLGSNTVNSKGSNFWDRFFTSAKSNWEVRYVDIRDDRVVFFGTINNNLSEFSYKIKSSNRGTFTVSSTYAEDMYNSTVFGRSLGGSIQVVKGGE